jgi:AraC-like DNA-binding protein
MEKKDNRDDSGGSRQARMVELLSALAPMEGNTLSALDGVSFLRVNRSLPRTPALYEPCIFIVCQGKKRGFLGEQTYVYDAQHFLVVSVPLPCESETEASEEEPMLAVCLHVDLAMVAELLLKLGESGTVMPAAPRGMYSTPMDEKLSAAVLRLFEALASPVDADVLGPTIMREIYYRILMGEQGGAMRMALNHQSHFGKIGKTLRRIHAAFHEDLDVKTLAAEANMSVPAFHANFKAVTSTSPMQYLKATRLHNARLLMVQDGVSAATASNRVGYESPSQFSREFKRMFGRSPVEETAYMKNLLVVRPAESFAPA